jgi:hypothetical protein
LWRRLEVKVIGISDQSPEGFSSVNVPDSTFCSLSRNQ